MSHLGWVACCLLLCQGCVRFTAEPPGSHDARRDQRSDLGQPKELSLDAPVVDGLAPTVDGLLPVLDGSTGDRGAGDLGSCVDPSCLLGCTTAGQCLELIPSNVDTANTPTSCAPLVMDLGGALTIDTTSCSIGAVCSGKVQSAPSSACLIALPKLTVPKAAVLTVTGERPLILLVSEDVTIDGTIVAAGRGPEPGPGGGAGGVRTGALLGVDGEGLGGGKVCTCLEVSFDDCGGGGGGFGTAGGRGGDESTGCQTPSAGGNVYSGTGLVGGSGGASGHDGTTPENVSGTGGGGGGAIQISSQREIRVDGAIDAGGGGGGAAQLLWLTGASGTGGGGGGSGGAIVLEAALITGTGWLTANGGGGSGGARGDPGGSSGAGQDATVGSTPAKGGAALGTGGVGGDGAAGLSPAKAGDASPQNSGAGGGGGGLGRIVLHWHKASYPAPTPKTSGLVSSGGITPQTP